MDRHAAHDELLDEAYPVFKIGELEFLPSSILYNCDPVAYRISVSEYEDFHENEDEDEE